MKSFLFLLFLPFLVSCATVDVEKRIMNTGTETREQRQITNPFFHESEPEIIVIERPVFVPQPGPPPPAAPPAGEQAVRASNSAGIVKPQDYSHAAMVYDYNPDWVYEIYAQPLRVCDVSLQPGERAVEPPFISDSERWILGAGVSFENDIPVQHIYVKPNSSGLEASLIINTNRRVYRIILRSYANIHMPVIRWRYPPGMPNNFLPSPPSETGDPQAETTPRVDPRLLSFNYRIRYGLFQKPYWLPELVFDDGGKTYVSFPYMVLQREYPAVYENRNDILNYRVIGSLIVIDKLIENITVRIGRTEISISKKRGGRSGGNQN